MGRNESIAENAGQLPVYYYVSLTWKPLLDAPEYAFGTPPGEAQGGGVCNGRRNCC